MLPPRDYFVGETISLYGLFLTGTTVGSIKQDQTLLLVRDPTNLDLSGGATLVLVGGGYVGGDFVATVASHVAGSQQVILTGQGPVDASLVPVGNPTAPNTVTCKVALPNGTEASPAASNIASGRYKALYTPAVEGEFYYRFIGTGAASADGWRKFVVLPARVP